MADDKDNELEYDYERGEGRFKHRWKNDYAGFLPAQRGPIGKCASSITDEVARSLLRSGVVEPDPFGLEGEPPERIYNVYHGIPYVAVPTQPGKSYHGYPWRGRMNPSVRDELASRAERDGYVKEFKKWLGRYGE